MRAFKELGTVHRGDPCLEYPGCWLVCTPKYLEDIGYGSMGCRTHEEAIAQGVALINRLEDALLEYNPRDISVCWEASDNDPRVGEVWFTGFYKAGYYNHWGQYRTT
jgi:hypothetical protein